MNIQKKSKSLFFSRVYLNRQGVPEELEVESYRPHKNFTILKFKGINTIAQARELVGLECMLPEEELSQLEEDKYYLFELVGSLVFTERRQLVGVVRDILFIKDNDLLVIEKGSEEILIPFTISICASVNLEKHEIVIKPPEGLLDLNEI